MSPVVDRPIALSTGEMGNDAKDKESFYDQCGEANRFTIHEIIGKGSYGVVCSATDNKTGERVAIKKITDVFEHVSDATRILREVKLLRVLKHPDIVEVKHIVLPQPARLQGHLRHLRAHGDGPAPGDQGERRSHAGAPQFSSTSSCGLTVRTPRTCTTGT